MMLRTQQQLVQPNLTYTRTVDGLGRGLYAKQDIAEADVLLAIQRPLVVSIDVPRLKDTCYACLNYEAELRTATAGQISVGPKDLLACTGCNVVRYCDKECQKLSWSLVHKYECSLFAQLYPNILPNNVRAIVQLLLLKKASKLPPQEWDNFMKLESHADRWRKRGGKDWENIVLMSKGVKEYSGTEYDEETLRQIFCKVLINCFTMVGAYYDPLGLAMHPLAALANHSCDYNALVEYSWKQRGTHPLQIRAGRPIARDEQVVVSYIEATNPVYWRRQELQDRYFFTCHCLKCDEFAVDEPPEEIEDFPKNAFFKTRARGLLESAKAEPSPSLAIPILQQAMKLLRKEKSHIPLYCQPLPAVRQQLIVSLIAAGRFHEALLYAYIQFLNAETPHLELLEHPVYLIRRWVIVVLTRLISEDHLSPPDDCVWYGNPVINYQTLSRYGLYYLYLKALHIKGSFFATLICRYVKHHGDTFTTEPEAIVELQKVNALTKKVFALEQDQDGEYAEYLESLR